MAVANLFVLFIIHSHLLDLHLNGFVVKHRFEQATITIIRRPVRGVGLDILFPLCSSISSSILIQVFYGTPV